MRVARNENQLKVMMICGWESNPYAEYVVQALLKKYVRIVFVTGKTLHLTIKNPLCSIHKILFEYRKGDMPLLIVGILQCIALIKLIKLLIVIKPDIIHFQSFQVIEMDWIFIIFLKLCRKKIVFTVHDTHSHKMSSLYDFIMKKVIYHCDALFVHTNYSKDFIQDKWKIEGEKIGIVPHGSYQMACDSSISRESARKTLKYCMSDYILLFFGFIRKYKGLDYLLPAVAEVKKELPNIRLIIAGQTQTPSLGKHYRHLISSLNLDSEVNYLDRFIQNEEVIQLFYCCDVVVLPYIKIDQSGVLCQSFMFSRPVITTNVGGFPELVREGITGYMVPPENVHALREKILQAWRCRQNLKVMGLNGREIIEKEYKWERHADETLKMYRKIIQS